MRRRGARPALTLAAAPVDPVPRLVRGSALAVPLGCIAVGAGGYAFLLLTARALGPEGYAPLAALWALVFTVAPGVFLPLEQEVARLVAGRAGVGVGAGPVVRQAVVLGSGLLGASLVLTLPLWPVLVSRLFDGDVLLMVGLVLSMVGYALAHVARGALAATGQTGRYGAMLTLEGALRVVAVVPLVLLAVTDVGPYGVVVGAAPLVAALAVLPGCLRASQGALGPGPPARAGELGRALALLLLSSSFSQALINVGPIAVKLLAEPAEEVQAGLLLAGLSLARVPVLALSALQAAVLPPLARAVALGAMHQVRRLVLRLSAGICGLTAVAVPVAAWLGPDVVALLFGADFRLPGRDLALLTLGTCSYTIALVGALGLVAAGAQVRLAAAWGTGTLVAALVVTIVPDLLLRVELGLIAGASTSAAVMLVVVLRLHPDA